MENDYQNILIIKPSALGDIVHALPVLPTLRARYPHARISWLVRREFAPLLECVDGLDDILLFDRKALGHWYYRPAAFDTLRQLRRSLKDARFDLVLDLQGLLRTGVFACMTGCPERIGMADCRELARLFYTRKVSRPAASVHVLDYYMAVLQEAGVKRFLHTCPLSAPPSAEQSLTEKLARFELHPGRFAVLIPGSAHASKCWPAERFAAVAEKLHEQYGFACAAVGTGKDAPLVGAIQQHCRRPIVDLTGQTSIPELVALFARAGAVVSNDTGPGYIAVETGTPTVILYGNVNPRRVGPYNRPECVAAIDPDRRGEAIRTTDPSHEVRHVTLHMVWERLTELLSETPKTPDNA